MSKYTDLSEAEIADFVNINDMFDLVELQKTIKSSNGAKDSK